MQSETPRISVIVPLTGAPAQALSCFQGLAAQPEGISFEVIVVDDASVGLDPLLAQLAGDVKVVHTGSRLGLGGSIALGVEHARGSIIALIRGAAVPASDWLTSIAQSLGDPDVGMVICPTAGSPGSSPLAGWSAALKTSDISPAALAGAPDPLVLAQLALATAEAGKRVAAAGGGGMQAPGARSGGARRSPGEPAELTIVIPTLDARSDRVQRCLGAIATATDVAHEIVIVDNGAPPQGFSGPVNAGIRAARTPYVVVMNDDVEPNPEWWPPLRQALDDGASVVFPLTVEGAMRYDFAAWCFALTQAGVSAFSHAPGEFFDPALTVWYQDTDLLQRLRQAGQAPVMVEASQIRHGLSETVATEDPELSAWVRRQVEADRERFLRKHPDAVLNGHALAAR